MQSPTTAAPRPLGILERIANFESAINVKQLAGILGVDEQIIYRQARSQVIPSFRVGTLVRFDPRVLSEWYSRQSVGN